MSQSDDSSKDPHEPHEVEALARALATGAHRGASRWVEALELAARAEEDAQDGELARVLAYTGLRLGEAVTLRWADVRFEDGTLVVHRAVSAEVETTIKAHRVRHVPLASPAAQALARLGQREHYTGREDYVFASRLGRRLDASALRRRVKVPRSPPGSGRSASMTSGTAPAACALVRSTRWPSNTSSAMARSGRRSATSTRSAGRRTKPASTAHSPR